MGASSAGLWLLEYSSSGDGKGGGAGGFEVEARYWVLRLHAALFRVVRGVGVCGWSSLS